jgi:cytosine/adenosine deaminase-related metal-dependent hydrolase
MALKKGALAVDRGRIVFVGASVTILGPASQNILSEKSLMMPGFVDARYPMEMSALRGVVDARST